MPKKTTPLFSPELKLKYKERYLIPLHTLLTSLQAVKEQHIHDPLYMSPMDMFQCFLSKISFRSSDTRTVHEQLAEFENILSQTALAASFSIHDEHFHITIYDFYKCEDTILPEVIAIVERAIWELENS